MHNIFSLCHSGPITLLKNKVSGYSHQNTINWRFKCTSFFFPWIFFFLLTSFSENRYLIPKEKNGIILNIELTYSRNETLKSHFGVCDLNSLTLSQRSTCPVPGHSHSSFLILSGSQSVCKAYPSAPLCLCVRSAPSPPPAACPGILTVGLQFAQSIFNVLISFPKELFVLSGGREGLEYGESAQMKCAFWSCMLQAQNTSDQLTDNWLQSQRQRGPVSSESIRPSSHSCY